MSSDQREGAEAKSAAEKAMEQGRKVWLHLYRLKIRALDRMMESARQLNRPISFMYEGRLKFATWDRLHVRESAVRSLSSCEFELWNLKDLLDLIPSFAPELAPPKSALANSAHLYPAQVYKGMGQTSYCEYGCGCWMGSSQSGSEFDEKIDPFGECPNAPKPPEPTQEEKMQMNGICPECLTYYGDKLKEHFETEHPGVLQGVQGE